MVTGRTLLGAIIRAGTIEYPEYITPEMFESTREKIIFETINAIAQTGKKPLLNIVINRLKKTKKLEAVGGCFLFRPLELSFMGFDRNGITDKFESTADAIKALNKLSAYWYSRNDDMYSGTITVITDFKQPKTNPRIGNRAKFLGGEFYINKAEHTWTYGAAPIIKLSVSRGMMYDNAGIMIDGGAGIIKDVGKQYKELERTST